MADKADIVAETVVERANRTGREAPKTQKHSYDRAVLAEARSFAQAADSLLRTADRVVAETRQGRKETAALLDRLEARLVSHG
jgi:hypothetical protein